MGETGGSTSISSSRSGRSERAGNQIVAEIPVPVAGSVLERRQRFEKRVADAHGEAALRLSSHQLRDEHLAAFEHAVCLGDAQRPVVLSISTRTAVPQGEVKEVPIRL